MTKKKKPPSFWPGGFGTKNKINYLWQSSSFSVLIRAGFKKVSINYGISLQVL